MFYVKIAVVWFGAASVVAWFLSGVFALNKVGPQMPVRELPVDDDAMLFV